MVCIYIYANMTGVFVDGKCDTIYTIHTDPMGKVLLRSSQPENDFYKIFWDDQNRMEQIGTVEHLQI